MTEEETKQYGEDMEAFEKISAAQREMLSLWAQIDVIKTLKDQCVIAFNVQEKDKRQKLAELETEIARLKKGTPNE